VLVPYWYVNGNAGQAVFPNWNKNKTKGKTSVDRCIKVAAKTARHNGMRVILKPHVDNLKLALTGNSDLYKDRTKLTFGGNGGSSQFWCTYGDIMVHYAKLAKRIRARVLVVGRNSVKCNMTAENGVT